MNDWILTTPGSKPRRQTWSSESRAWITHASQHLPVPSQDYTRSQDKRLSVLGRECLISTYLLGERASIESGSTGLGKESTVQMARMAKGLSNRLYGAVTSQGKTDYIRTSSAATSTDNALN
jgi:hypothetical protein